LDYEKGIRDEMEERLGTFRGKRLQPGHCTVFPNMSWLPNLTARIWHPRGPFHTEVWAFAVVDKLASDEIKHEKLLNYLRMFGPSGTHEQDDMDNWGQSTRSGRSMVGKLIPQDISMGISHETTEPRLPGVVAPNAFSEINQRGLYRQWEKMMNSDSWAGISIDPISAQFEGSATFRG